MIKMGLNLVKTKKGIAVINIQYLLNKDLTRSL